MDLLRFPGGSLCPAQSARNEVVVMLKLPSKTAISLAEPPRRPRRSAIAAGRTVYLAMLAVLLFSLADFLFGNLVAFQADGLVIRDRIAVATTYLARVTSVDVREGRLVREGDVVLHV